MARGPDGRLLEGARVAEVSRQAIRAATEVFGAGDEADVDIGELLGGLAIAICSVANLAGVELADLQGRIANAAELCRQAQAIERAQASRTDSPTN